MGEISLDRESSIKILNNPASSADARAIAGCAMAFFECSTADEPLHPDTRAITQKLLRMTAAALDDNREQAGEREDA